MTGYTGFSGKTAEQSGNYLALKATKETGVTKVTAQIIPSQSNRGEVELDSDMNIVFRVTSPDQVIRFRAYKSNGLVQSNTYTLKGLTLTPETE